MNSVHFHIRKVIFPKLVFTPVAYSHSRQKNWRRPEDTGIPKNVIEPWITAHQQAEKGAPYDSKPFKMFLEKGKTYMWCSCGWSHNQPICDNTHRFLMYKITMKPVMFMVEETKEYWLCNCKQTKHRPFCDGSHRDPQIQEKCKRRVLATGS